MDVLLIDRGGKGDVHVVMIRERADDLPAIAQELLAIPGHYRWVASLVDSSEPSIPGFQANIPKLDPDDRMGRIGVIQVASEPYDTLSAEVKVKAERFKGSFYDLADRFTELQPADYEVR